MKPLIAIPSKNRPEILQKCVLSWVIYTGFDYCVFVEPQDEQVYSVLTPEHIEILPDNNRGLGYSKMHMLAYAKKYNYDLIFKIDDDVSGFKGRGLHQSSKVVDNFKILMNDCLEVFEKHKEVKGIGFPYRNELFEIRKWTGVNQRFQTCYITRTDWWHADECISCFEDYAAYMYIRAKNGTILRYGKMGIDCLPVGEGTGGHQDFDRLQQAKNEIDYLKNLYPAIIAKKVDKPWRIEPKFGGEFYGGKKL